jgi:hypothetical protein
MSEQQSGAGNSGTTDQPPLPAAPAAPAARPQPPVLSVPGGAGRLGPALVGRSPGWAARGVRADAVGGKGRVIFLYSP